MIDEFVIQLQVFDFFTVQFQVETDFEYTIQFQTLDEYSVQYQLEIAEYTVQFSVFHLDEYTVQFKVAVAFTVPDDATYRQYTDCTAVDVILPSDTLEDGYHYIEKLAPDGTYSIVDSLKTISGSGSIITFKQEGDGVYFAFATGENTNMRMPILIDCKIAIAFNRENERSTDANKAQTSDYSNWLTYYLLYRGVVASFKTEQYANVMKMIGYINEHLTCSFGC